MQLLTDYLKSRTRKPFKAEPVYAQEGDSLTFIFDNAAYYAQRIDDFLTVYRAFKAGSGGEKDRLVGCQLKGVPKMLELIGNFELTIDNNPITLTLIFMMFAAKSDSEVTKLYVELANRDESKKPIDTERLIKAA